MSQGLCFTVEGIEGSGKSSALACILNGSYSNSRQDKLAERIRTCVTEPSEESICIKAIIDVRCDSAY